MNTAKDRLERLGDLFMEKPKGMTSEGVLSDTAKALHADLMELIGEDEPLHQGEGGYGVGQLVGRNSVRAELRQKLNKYFGVSDE